MDCFLVSYGDDIKSCMECWRELLSVVSNVKVAINAGVFLFVTYFYGFHVLSWGVCPDATLTVNKQSVRVYICECIIVRVLVSFMIMHIM